MATVDTQTLITEVGNRLRDPNNFAHPRATVVDVLSRVQRCLNIGLRLKLATASFAPTAKRCLYQNTEIASDIGQIIAIRDSARDLMPVPFVDFGNNSPEWLRTDGPQPEVYSLIGRDLVVIAPFQKTAPPTLDVVYAIQTVALVDNVADFAVIPDDYLPLLMDFTEAILLMRGRVFTPESALPALLQRIQKDLGVDAKEQSTRHGVA